MPKLNQAFSQSNERQRIHAHSFDIFDGGERVVKLSLITCEWLHMSPVFKIKVAKVLPSIVYDGKFHCLVCCEK